MPNKEEGRTSNLRVLETFNNTAQHGTTSNTAPLVPFPHLALPVVTSLATGTVIVGLAASQLAGDERVADVVAGTRAHSPVVAVPVVSGRAVSAGAARVGVAVVLC